MSVVDAVVEFFQILVKERKILNLVQNQLIEHGFSNFKYTNYILTASKQSNVFSVNIRPYFLQNQTDLNGILSSFLNQSGEIMNAISDNFITTDSSENYISLAGGIVTMLAIAFYVGIKYVIPQKTKTNSVLTILDNTADLDNTSFENYDDNENTQANDAEVDNTQLNPPTYWNQATKDLYNTKFENILNNLIPSIMSEYSDAVFLNGMDSLILTLKANGDALFSKPIEEINEQLVNEFLVDSDQAFKIMEESFKNEPTYLVVFRNIKQFFMDLFSGLARLFDKKAASEYKGTFFNKAKTEATRIWNIEKNKIEPFVAIDGNDQYFLKIATLSV